MWKNCHSHEEGDTGFDEDSKEGREEGRNSHCVLD